MQNLGAKKFKKSFVKFVCYIKFKDFLEGKIFNINGDILDLVEITGGPHYMRSFYL